LNDYVIVVPDYEIEDSDNLVAITEAVWEANQSGTILYGFGSPTEAFNDGGANDYLFGGRSFGLTCASFVLAVFHKAMLPLVDYETWPSARTGEVEWQKQIIAKLKEYIVGRGYDDNSHVTQVENSVPAVRFRPVEVAASGLENIPTDFANIHSLIENLCKSSNLKI